MNPGQITHQATSILGYVYKPGSVGNRTISVAGGCAQIMFLVTSWALAPHCPVTTCL